MTEMQLIITISDLISISRPLTGAASLSYCSPLKKDNNQHPQVHESLSNLRFPNKHSNPKCFTPFNFPVILVGTVDLPVEPSDHIFLFSDNSCSISCAILDFDLKIIGCKVHVLAWNFLPLRHQCGGLLEVIRWSTLPSLTLSKDMPVLLLRKGVELPGRKGIVAVLRSVSPVFTVPCRNTSSSLDSIGFLGDVFTCKCSICSKPFSVDRFDYSIWAKNSHLFTNSEFVYFLKPSSGWRLAMAELVGKVIMVSGLKKKTIFVGEKTSYAMYVTPLEMSVFLGQFPLRNRKLENDVRAGMTEVGTVYYGIITGVYMQGMAIELDKKVWLLITDPNLAPQATLRVGAIISIRNFQLARPVLAWFEINLLVSCCRTTIGVKAFSLSDTRCYFRSHGQSLLMKFVESLVPIAKFWLLLFIACFRRKFANILSNKEILGSRNKEGLVQVYARTFLHSHFFQPQHGIFMEFCQPPSTVQYEKNDPPMKLVVPIYNFIFKCEETWGSLLEENQCHDDNFIIGGNVPCESIPSSHIIRRIISSDILGCILMGSIKSTSSGKLLLVDATGSLDVVIPDILPSFCCQGIHEIREFKVVLEGPSLQEEFLNLHSVEELSCRGIFEELTTKKKLNQLGIYVHFYLKDSSCLNAPINLPLCMGNDSKTNANGIGHLLLLSHKFPAVETYKIDTDEVHRSSLFAEAFLLPYDIIFVDEDAHNYLSGHIQQKLDRDPTYLSSLNNPEMRNCKKQKNVDTYSKSCLKLADLSPDFPCLFVFARSNPQIPHAAAYFCNKRGSGLENKSVGLHSVLLEFLSDCYIMYQSLQVGEYYIMKCSKECPFYVPKGKKKRTCDKVSLSSETDLWKVSFSFSMTQHQEEQSLFQTCMDNLIIKYETCLGNACRNDPECLQLYTRLNNITDVHLVISQGTLGSISQIKALKEEMLGHFSVLQEVLTVTSFIQIMKSNTSNFLCRVSLKQSSFLDTSLFSIRGDIDNMHFYSFKSGSFLSKNENVLRQDGCICLHVCDDHNMIYIRAKHHNYVYPVGLGPGVNATFHRVLVKCCSGGFFKLVLTSVSFVVINSVKETDLLSRKRPTMHFQLDTSSVETYKLASLSLISQFIQLKDNKLARLLCRVVTIHFLVLEKGSGSNMDINMPSIKISSAEFLLDDGSSLCCCWADAERAEMLLRLNEILCNPFSQCGFSSVKKNMKPPETIGHQLNEMLRKHKKVFVKNYRAGPDASFLDFVFNADSNEIFSNAEESLLRFLVSNACQGPTFSVSGHLMDSTSVGLLDGECKELQDAVRSLPNIWATEVKHINPLEQARNLLYELSNGQCAQAPNS